MSDSDKNATKKVVSVTLIKSSIGYPKGQKATVRALGLHRMHETVEHYDSPVLRGMIAKIPHLLSVEEDI